MPLRFEQSLVKWQFQKFSFDTTLCRQDPYTTAPFEPLLGIYKDELWEIYVRMWACKTAAGKATEQEEELQ